MAEQTQHDEREDQVYHQTRNSNPNGTRKRFEKRIKTRLRIGALFQGIIARILETKYVV